MRDKKKTDQVSRAHSACKIKPKLAWIRQFVVMVQIVRARRPSNP